MIYRIHSNIQHYLSLHIEGREARKALGQDSDFDIDERPISYLNHWKTMKVSFYDAFDGDNKKAVPDISLRLGKLFLNERAYQVLKVLLESDGEFLPVITEFGGGYIYNCLTVADDLNATDEKLCIHDPLNDRFSIGFIESRLVNCHVFRAQIDPAGYFCKQKMKDLVEQNNLTGISICENISNPFPEELNMRRLQ